MLTLAVDPSLRCSGWCLLDGETLLRTGTVFVPRKLTGVKALRHLGIEARTIAPNGVGQLVLEDQYSRINAATAITLGRASGVWIGAVYAERVEIVNPMTWGKSFSLPHKRQNRKQASMRIANTIHPIPGGWSEDAAEAYLIGLWAAREWGGE